MKPYVLPDLSYDYSALDPSTRPGFSNFTTPSTTRPTSTE
jgi:hypothetical protein